MFVDAAKDHYPLIIVGSGPAGMSLAHELVTRHGQQDILMIESGDLVYDPDINADVLAEAHGDLAAEYFAAHSIRQFGGTSAVWAGLCGVLEDRAFRTGDWPFSRDTLLPYYKRAVDVLELPADTTSYIEAPLDADSNINYKPIYLSPPVRFGTKFEAFARESDAISVLLRTTVSSVLTEGQNLLGCRVTGPDGSEREISADRLVLACGGIENPRLLLASGLTGGDVVGRYLSEHPHLFNFGRVILGSRAAAVSHQPTGERINAYMLDDAANVSDDARSFMILLDTQRIDAGLGDGENPVVTDFTVIGEMAPDADNRVELSDQTTRYGAPKAKITFNFNYHDEHITQWRRLGESFLRENHGRFSSPKTKFDITGGGHMIGTTRMGEKGTGCANSFGEFHDCNGLYIAGSSLFPAAGASNPTFTIVALALRLADHLAEVS